MFELYRPSLDWWMRIGYPFVKYCGVCYWGTAVRAHNFCPYSHGALLPRENYISELTEGI